MASPLRVTVLYFHPFSRRSRANRALWEAIQSLSLENEGFEARDLYELYPDFSIDVEAEQALLERTDVLVLQHPIYWYSCPSLMKEWIDAVLEHGWAYGPGGDKLAGKKWMQAITTGSPPEAYERAGHHVFTLPEVLRPFEQTARFCRMTPLEPFITQSAATLDDARLRAQAERYRERLAALASGNLPPEHSTRSAPEVRA